MQYDNDLFLKACKKEAIERTPIWIMRQAGRYLPEYRAVRKKADFLTMCRTPELAAEVTIQPIDLIGVDAAIIFSDILVIPEAMGMTLEMHEGRGPVFPEPVRSESDLKRVKKVDPADELNYVMDAVSLTVKELNGRVPLIGFAGSPWTLLTYMVEGGGSKNFAKVKNLIYSNPAFAHKLLEMIADITAQYLSAKIKAGAAAVQIFDTWGGILGQQEFYEFSLRYIERIIQQLTKGDEPVIVFAKGVHHSLDKLAQCGADVLGLDWTMDIGKVRAAVGSQVALQGNLDPTVLYAEADVIADKALSVMEAYGNGSGHIFNLGHGILPDIKPEHAKALVHTVKTKSQRFH